MSRLAPCDCPFGCATHVNDWVGGPINTRTGNYYYSREDFSIPALGGPLRFERSYNTLATSLYTTSLGSGWTHNYDLNLTLPNDPGGEPDIVIVKGCHGSRFRFADNGDGTYEPFPGVWATLTRTLASPYSYTLTGVEQSTYVFDETGLLAEIRDPQGQAITLAYDGTQLARVEDGAGQRFLAFGYDGQGRLVEVRDPIDRVARYGYDAAGDLAVVTDTRDLVWTYAYTGTHLLYEVRDPLGHVVERTEYDSTSLSAGDGTWRAVRQWDGTLGEPLQIGYGISGTTSITDPNGHVTTDRYDSQGTLVWQGDPYGSSTRSYDSYLNWTSTTDANGHATGYAFNQKGQPEVVTDTLGGVTGMEYDERNSMTALTDAAGHTMRYAYDEHNNLISTTNPLLGTVLHGYDEYGHVISTTDELGHTTLYGYDELGQRVVMTDTLGHVTTYGYDAVGRLVTTTVGIGDWGLEIGERVTVNEYDDGDNLVCATRNYLAGYPQNWQDTYNLVTEYEYDEVGRRVVTTDTLGNVTRSEHDAAGRLVRSVQNYLPGQPQNYQDTYNLVTEYGYDAVGNQALVTDTLGNVTYTEYDELNRVARTWRNYLEGYPQNWQDTYNLVTEYGYDAVGNQVLVTDTLGYVTYTEYDELNRPVTATANYVDSVYDPARPDEDLWTVTLYDEVGNAVQVTDHASHITCYEYDALGQLITTTDALSGATVNIYDAAGNRVAVTDADGRVTRYEYDALGRVVTTTDALSGTTVTEYDALGQRMWVTDAEGNSTRFKYDGAGRLVTTTNALSGTTVVHYDALGRCTQVTDAESRTTTYGYDALGRTVAITDGTGAVTRYGYDALGRQVVVTDGTGIATYSSYDSLGRLSKMQDAGGNATQYGYDALGNRVVMTDANGIVTRYGYDARSRLITVTENYSTTGPSDHQTNMTTRYGYDGVGNRTVITDANGHSTHYNYDVLDRLVVESDPLSHTTEYGYDRMGNRTIITDADGGVTLYAYDGLDRLTGIQYPDSSVQYAYDRVGNRTAMTDTTGTTTYVYDALYRPITITAPATGTVGYRYDGVGNRTRLLYPGGQEVIYTYDGAHRLWKVEDWQGRVVRYRYDAAGRVVTVTRPGGLTPVEPITVAVPGGGTGLTPAGPPQLVVTAVVTCVPLSGVRTVYWYDGAGRLVEVEHKRGNRLLARYEYVLDGVGNRAAVTETVRGLSGPPVTTPITYTYDGLNRLVGADYSSGEAFEYGYDPVGNWLVMTETITSTVVTTYTYDAANRLVTARADDDGVTWHYTHDGRGNLVRQTPGGTEPAEGETRYTYDGAGQMARVELYTGGAYTTLAEAAYNADGERVRLTTWAEGSPLTVTYGVFLGQLLVADDGTQATLYLHGRSLIAEYGGDGWAYHLRDGEGSLRQVANKGGAIKLVRTYKPFGGILQEEGAYETAFGFLGAQLDRISGLMYAGGRYYDPATGRFLTPERTFDPYNPRTLNPYAPLQNPALWLLAPLAVIVAFKGRKKRRKYGYWLLLLLIVGMGASATLAGCGPQPPPSPTKPPPLPPTSPSPAPPLPSPTLPPSPPPSYPTPLPTLLPTTCVPTPTLDEKARITREEIQAAGGTMEAYLRSEEDAALLTRLAMAESRQSDEDRVYVMWIVRLRMEIAYSVNVPQLGQKTTLQQEVFAPGQFAVIPEMLGITDPRAAALGGTETLACGGAINGAIYPCDVSGHPTNPPDPDDPNAGALAEWKATYRSAQMILSVPSAQFSSAFPGELRGYDGFLAKGSGGMQFHPPDGNEYFSTTDRDVDWLWPIPTPGP